MRERERIAQSLDDGEGKLDGKNEDATLGETPSGDRSSLSFPSVEIKNASLPSQTRTRVRVNP